MDMLSVWSRLDAVGYGAMRLLVGALWQSSILLVATGALTWLLRKRRASVRHALWVGALVAAPLLPLIGGAVLRAGAPQAPLRILPAYTQSMSLEPEIELPDLPAGTLEPSPHAAEHEAALQQPPAAPRRMYPWAMLLMGYAAGLVGFLAWIGMGRTRIRRWVRSAAPVLDGRVRSTFEAARETIGLGRDFLVLESDRVPAPMSYGLVHPVVLLPRGLAGRLSELELRALAIHELAHLKRSDSLVLSAAALVRAALFFHPLVWLACRQISNLSEVACDDTVLDTGSEPVSYAKMLTRLAEELPRRAIGTELASGILLSKGAFLRRVEAILSERRDQIHRLTRVVLASTLAGAVLSLAVALALPVGEKREQEAAVADETAEEAQDQGSQKVLAAAQAIRSQLEKIEDMSCILRSRLTGTANPDFIRNRIKILEILRSRGQGPAGQADAELAELKKQLDDLPSYDSVREQEWRTRSDGLFWFTQPVMDGERVMGRIVIGYDGESCREYQDWERRSGVIRKEPPRPIQNPEFGLSVHQMRIDGFLERAAAAGKVSCREAAEPGVDEGLMIITAVAPAGSDSDQDSRAKPDIWARMWLDPKQGFMPRRIDTGLTFRLSLEDPPIGSSAEMECKELSPGLWFPVSAKISCHEIANLADPDKPVEEWKVVSFPSTAAILMSLEDLKINQGLTEEDFRVAFPEGTQVVDQREVEELTFGPVIERVVTESIDLDTGEQLTPPPEMDRRDEQAGQRWIQESGTDAFAGTGPDVRGLVCFDMVAFPISAESWATTNPRSFIEALGRAKAGSPVFVSGKGELPATYLFRTRERGMGILQITGFTEEPKGVKIRYKMVQPVRHAWLTHYGYDSDLAAALVYDSEMNGGDLDRADRSKAESHYLAYLERVTDSALKARIYAQLGALYAVAINPRRGEKPDLDKAKYYFRKVLELEPERLDRATVVARTQLASMSEPGEERLGAWMDFYEWTESVGEQNLKDRWLPSRPGVPVPSERELTGLLVLWRGVRGGAETNMVAEAKDIMPVPEEALRRIIRAFPGTHAETLAKEALKEVAARRGSHQPAEETEAKEPASGEAVEGAQVGAGVKAEPAAITAPAEAWGEAVEGLQVRLRADKPTWTFGEAPLLRADVRHVGSRELLLSPEEFCELEFDGRWYRDRRIGKEARFLRPGSVSTGQQWENRRIDVVEYVVPTAGNLAPSLEPGKHVVRVAFVAQPAGSDGGTPIRAISNPVELEIKVRPAEARNLLGVTLAIEPLAKVYRAGHSIPIGLIVTNAGAEPIRFMGEPGVTEEYGPMLWNGGEVSVVSPKGALLKPVRAVARGRALQIPTGEEIRKAIELTEFFDFDVPGTYTVRVSYYVGFQALSTPVRASSNTLAIEVLPRDDAAGKPLPGIDESENWGEAAERKSKGLEIAPPETNTAEAAGHDSEFGSPPSEDAGTIKGRIRAEGDDYYLVMARSIDTQSGSLGGCQTHGENTGSFTVENVAPGTYDLTVICGSDGRNEVEADRRFRVFEGVSSRKGVPPKGRLKESDVEAISALVQQLVNPSLAGDLEAVRELAVEDYESLRRNKPSGDRESWAKSMEERLAELAARKVQTTEKVLQVQGDGTRAIGVIQRKHTYEVATPTGREKRTTIDDMLYGFRKEEGKWRFASGQFIRAYERESQAPIKPGNVTYFFEGPLVGIKVLPRTETAEVVIDIPPSEDDSNTGIEGDQGAKEDGVLEQSAVKTGEPAWGEPVEGLRAGLSCKVRAVGSGEPEIFNTDQGIQFTSEAFTGILETRGIAISMDGRGRVFDNIFSERLWRTVKQEEVYLKDYADPGKAREGLRAYFRFYNERRLHQALSYSTPAEVYDGRAGGERDRAAARTVAGTPVALRAPCVPATVGL